MRATNLNASARRDNKSVPMTMTGRTEIAARDKDMRLVCVSSRRMKKTEFSSLHRFMHRHTRASPVLTLVPIYINTLGLSLSLVRSGSAIVKTSLSSFPFLFSFFQNLISLTAASVRPSIERSSPRQRHVRMIQNCDALVSSRTEMERKRATNIILLRGDKRSIRSKHAP